MASIYEIITGQLAGYPILPAHIVIFFEAPLVRLNLILTALTDMGIVHYLILSPRY